MTLDDLELRNVYFEDCSYWFCDRYRRNIIGQAVKAGCGNDAAYLEKKGTLKTRIRISWDVSKNKASSLLFLCVKEWEDFEGFEANTIRNMFAYHFGA